MSQHTSDPATLRLPFKEKLAYGMGDLGSNILLDIGTLYLLKFYTDVLGLPGTYGGIIFPDCEVFYRLHRYGHRDHARFPAQDRPEREIPPVRAVCSLPGNVAGDCQLRRHTV